MKKLLFCLLTLLLFFIIPNNIHLHAESTKFFTISANPAENSNNGMNIVWHTEKDDLSSYLLYTKKSDTSWTSAVRVDPKSTLNSAFAGLNAKYGTSSDSLNHPYELTKNEVSLTNLDAGTEYMYKITDGTESSDIRYFKTGNKDFNFVWTSDFHAYYADARRLKKASVAIDKCIDAADNKIDFILSTGDIVAHGGTYEWWKQVSEATWMKKYMFATTLGNHDWMTSAGTYFSNGSSFAFMDACFNNPKNGFEGQENICYYFYYGDVLFVCMNTETESAKYLGITSSEFVKMQQDWVETVLQNNSAQYIFLFQHYQAFSTSGAYNSTGYTRWYDICDRYGVDVFLSGNSHVYMRSLPIYEGEVSTDQYKGTVYMVAPSSDGERGVEYSPHTANTDKIVKSWSDSRAQAASLVKVTKDGISFQLINYDGTVLDSCTVLPKRSPTSELNTDLSGFDKNAFEESFRIESNELDITCPTLYFLSDAATVLKSMKIYNRDTNQVYYNGVVYKGMKELTLSGAVKGIVNIEIELKYIDSTTKNLSFEVDNIYNWGEVSNPKIVEENGVFYFEWDEDLNYNVIDSKNIYVDNSFYKKVDENISKVALPDRSGKHKVKLVVKDIDGEIIYVSTVLNYEVAKKYTVVFVDQDNNELKREEVLEGSSATPPTYNPPEGYNFTGWDQDYSNVTQDLVVKVVLEKIETPDNPPTPTTPEQPTKKSCKKNSMVIIAFINAVALLLYFRRKH